jgi:putative nucleotidyltransferase with HDIG domain
MTTQRVTQDLVIEKAAELPGFPRVITEIIATLDDPEANLNVLAELIQRDPIIAARVLSLANNAASRTRHLSEIRDIYTATSLIGMGRVRQMALISSCTEYFDKIAPENMPSTFWQHSVAVGICGEEIALYVTKPVSSGAALIAGLLHDVGQLWLYRFNPEGFRAAWSEVQAHSRSIEEAEREQFGADHSVIGAWLAEYWQLPPPIIAAIRFHHACDGGLDQPIVPVTHIAEVLSNALDLTGRKENHVTHISSAACRSLGFVWNDESRMLFGRIDARSRHANAFFEAT